MKYSFTNDEIFVRSFSVYIVSVFFFLFSLYLFSLITKTKKKMQNARSKANEIEWTTKRKSDFFLLFSFSLVLNYPSLVAHFTRKWKAFDEYKLNFVWFYFLQLLPFSFKISFFFRILFLLLFFLFDSLFENISRNRIALNLNRTFNWISSTCRFILQQNYVFVNIFSCMHF